MQDVIVPAILLVLAWIIGYAGLTYDARKDKLANCQYHSWEYVPGKGMVCSRCTRVAGEKL